MTGKHTEEDPPYFDEEEREMIEPILEAMEQGKLKSVPNFEQRKKELERMAREDLATKIKGGN